MVEHIAIDIYRADFFSAINRILSGCPTHADLIVKSSKGKLKLNPLSVAKEAGHSRSKLYDCEDVLLKISELNGSSSGSTSDTTPLREENKLLRAHNRQLVSGMAAVLIRMRNGIPDSNKEAKKKHKEEIREDNSVVLPFVRDD